MPFSLVLTTSQGIAVRVASGMRFGNGKCQVVFRHCTGVWNYPSLDAVKAEHCNKNVDLVY